jgi:hypothetical protein
MTHLHLVPRSKNEWSYTYIPPYTFMAWCSFKAQEHLYVYRYDMKFMQTVTSESIIMHIHVRK